MRDDRHSNFVFQREKRRSLQNLLEILMDCIHHLRTIEVNQAWIRSGGNITIFLESGIASLLNRLEVNGCLLEVGCGAGFAANYLSNSCQNINVSGMDISHKAIRLARDNFHRDRI